jgi:hypothetical protein
MLFPTRTSGSLRTAERHHHIEMLKLPRKIRPASLLRQVAYPLIALSWLSSVGSGDEPEVAIPRLQLQFFESKIRPVLVEHCYRCHGADALAKGQLKGGLRVDNREGLLRGGDSGPAIVPGKPADSPILEALRYETFEMPPDGKLSDQVIADFQAWIKSGAADPRDESTAISRPEQIDIEASRKHWAYRPLRTVLPPTAGRSGSGIDAFVDRKLASAHLQPNPPADRRTLIRRLYFDLHGLPPSPTEIECFLNDHSALAYQRLVDRLLASPEFGRRWGRHWLDIVRFAESVTLRGLVQHEAWRYRDYVVESFNGDLPYDQFLREQLAGDLMPADSLKAAQRMHVATTFLTLTNANLEDQDKEKLRMDVVDEQLRVIGTAFLALTIGCARCHDHKFDPIPTRDYYAMAGILRNTRTLKEGNVSSWLDLPLPMEKDEAERHANYQSQLAEVKKQLQRLKKQLGNSARQVKLADLPGVVVDDEMAEFQGEWKRSTSIKPFVASGYQHDQNRDRGKKTATFVAELAVGDYEVRLSYTSDTNRSSRVLVTIHDDAGEHVVHVNQRSKPAIDGMFVSLGIYRFSTNRTAKVVVSNTESDGHVIVDAIQFLRASNDKERGEVVEKNKQDLIEIKTRVSDLESQLKELEKTAPLRTLYMGVVEWPEIGDMPIHIRGNVHQHGPIVPRGFLQIGTYSTPPVIPETEGGRLQLAEWLVAESNPLTARVMANRVWNWLFGVGLVRSTENFGFSGESPSHFELLDYLAHSLIDRQWSVKSLIRQMVLSDAYRRSSTPTPLSLAKDPANRLLWRMSRRRLEAECIQDAILSASGQLDLAHGGPTIPTSLSADYGYRSQSRRRTIYWPVLRNSIPDLIVAFDGADPSLVVGSRNVSSVAPQALFLMNNPWVIEQSEFAAQELLKSSENSHTAAGRRILVQRLFQRILGRAASVEEQQTCVDFLTFPQITSDSERLDRWTRLVQSLFSTLDFRYRF